MTMFLDIEKNVQKAKKQPSGSIKNYHKNSMDRDICIGLKIKKTGGILLKFIGAT